MSLDVGAEAGLQLTKDWVGLAWLVEMDFSTGVQRFTNAPVNIDVGSNTYLGFGTLSSISPVKESENVTGEKMTLGFTVVNQAMLALAIGNVAVYRGRSVRLYLQVLDDSFARKGDPVPRWFGYMDKIKISRKRPANIGDKVYGTIEMECTRAGMSRSRRYEGLRLTHAQHTARYPGDNGFEYVQKLIEQPTRWLSRAFQIR
jgi:hypothetical protein